MDNKIINILCIDDEPQILSSLKRVLRPLKANVDTAENAIDGLQLLNESSYHVIICDMRMPVMDGATFFERVYHDYPDTYRILLTGFSDMESTIAAINKGNIHRFIGKPWDNQHLLDEVQQGAEAFILKQENKRLTDELKKSNVALKKCNQSLEKKVELRTKQIRKALREVQENQQSLERVLFNILSASPGFDGGFIISMTHLCENLARICGLSQEQMQQVGLASLISEIGLLGVDEAVRKQPFYTLNYDQQQHFFSQVNHVSTILGPVQHLDDVINIISQQYEHFNGSGYPGNAEGSDIHIGARILCVARDYYWFKTGRFTDNVMNNKLILKEMRKSSGINYDPDILKLLGDKHDKLVMFEPDVGIGTDQLKPGMTLKDSIFTPNHILMLSQGHVFTEGTIKKLKDFEQKQKLSLRVKVSEDVKG